VNRSVKARCLSNQFKEGLNLLLRKSFTRINLKNGVKNRELSVLGWKAKIDKNKENGEQYLFFNIG
jgi:hypothetical protein